VNREGCRLDEGARLHGAPCCFGEEAAAGFAAGFHVVVDAARQAVGQGIVDLFDLAIEARNVDVDHGPHAVGLPPFDEFPAIHGGCRSHHRP